MAKAICIACGHAKPRPWKACRKCGLDPSSDEMALAKSVYLSIGRFEDPAEQAKYEDELDQVGRDLSIGKVVHYDEKELARLVEQKKAVDSVPPLAPWIALMRIFLPAFIGLAIIGAIWLLLRLLR